MFRLPLINRFTCNQKQLPFFINEFNNNGIQCIIGYINENPTDYRENFAQNKTLLSQVTNNYIAIKLSALNINNDYKGALERSKELCEIGIYNNNKMIIDAEYNSIQKDITQITDLLLEQFNKRNINIYKTYQLYRNDQLDIFKDDVMNKNYKIGLKIVRGAYFNEEKGSIWMNKNKKQTDDNYNNAIKFFVDNNIYNKLICATHNEDSISLARSFNNNKIQYAQLMGMSNKLTDRIKNDSVVYKYIPYGDIKDTIPYLIRRLYENIDFTRYLLR